MCKIRQAYSWVIPLPPLFSLFSGASFVTGNTTVTDWRSSVIDAIRHMTGARGTAGRFVSVGPDSSFIAILHEKTPLGGVHVMVIY